MDEFVGEYQYAIAWAVYVLAGCGCCIFWWKITAYLRHGGWRDLLRGAALVVIFTPWFAGDSHEFYAPAIVVILMDLILGSSDNGLAASLVLLIAAALMLGVLITRHYMANRASPERIQNKPEQP